MIPASHQPLPEAHELTRGTHNLVLGLLPFRVTRLILYQHQLLARGQHVLVVVLARSIVE